jgi:serine/threonine protein phosphatase PrpC
VATPDVREEALQGGDEAMILASDGLWDVLSNQDAVNMIRDIPVRVRALLLCRLPAQALKTHVMQPAWSMKPLPARCDYLCGRAC